MPMQMIDTRDFFIRDLLEGMDAENPEMMRLRHPFVQTDIRDARDVSAALEALNAPLSSIRETARYMQPGIGAKCWEAELDGQMARGVTIVSVSESNAGIDSTILLGTYPSASLWRDLAMANTSESMPPEAWDPAIPLGIPHGPASQESELDPKLPFPVAEDMVFHSPILSKPVLGRELVSKVFAHTSAIYGDRRYGPKIQSGNKVLSLWDASVSGHQIQVANEIRFNGKGEADEMVMSMRPWPVVNLFRDQCIARTNTFLDSTFFGF